MVDFASKLLSHPPNPNHSFSIFDEKREKANTDMQAYLADCQRDNLAGTEAVPPSMPLSALPAGSQNAIREITPSTQQKLAMNSMTTESGLTHEDLSDLLAKVKEKNNAAAKASSHFSIAIPNAAQLDGLVNIPHAVRPVNGKFREGSPSVVDGPLSTSGTAKAPIASAKLSSTEFNTVKHEAKNQEEHPELRDFTPEEISNMRRELELVRNEVSRMDQELVQQKITEATVRQAIGPDANFTTKDDIFNMTSAEQQGAFSTAARPRGSYTANSHESRSESFMTPDDARSEVSDTTHYGNYNRVPPADFWGRPSSRGNNNMSVHNIQGIDQSQYYPRQVSSVIQPQGLFPQTRGFSGPPNLDGRFGSGIGMLQQPLRRANTHGNRPIPPPLQGLGQGPMNVYPMGPTSAMSAPYGSRGAWGPPHEISPPRSAFNMYSAAMQYQPQPIGTPLSPTAAEFSLAAVGATPWNSQPSPTSDSPHTYVSTSEPLNYRRMLDRSVSCNWKYIVDKIVCNNDQQASIFLQQKLKVGTFEQKYDIVEAILAQAYQLMVNRFGNFLIQRAFEHGTQEQVINIANIIRGNTLVLSKDAFGCHVIQKAFDCVPEEFKAMMVHELLRQIPDTVIHRYACHVWQKLFELRWKGSPPQIMSYVNEALRGMWPDVALGETGSLVVQNVFENCLDEDKRPCIDEVLGRIDLVARGQFGNWCIQHICEHGAPADRTRAIDHVLYMSTDYSVDQFASKVVEKCLKIGGSDFLERYLNRVCEGRADRPRIPLVDIASDQYGNYLIQWILTHASPQHREIVAGHIRKHMVSLRGSKFGSRVGLLCSNPAVATRPGPAIGPPAGSRGFATTRYQAPTYGR